MSAYLFRYALGIIIYLLWWIRTGSPKLERVDRIRNDLIDLSFVVYGTYYDGFSHRRPQGGMDVPESVTGT